jgi:hypothetical protein
MEPGSMARSGKAGSIALVALFLTSVLLSLTLPAHPVSASNETTSGTITGTETWAGTHTLTGDVTIAPGAKLIIQAGATITFPNGTHLDVRGSICAGVISCGSSSNADSAMKITLRWEEPLNSSARGECWGISQGNQEIWIDDPSCNEGVLMRNSIDLSETGMRHVTFDGPWGVPYYVTAVSEFRYAALVLDGASPTLINLEFMDVNSSSVLTTDLAQPSFIGGTFVVGNDASRSIVGPALQIYSSGSSITPFTLSDITLSSTNNGCGTRDRGRAAIWAEKSFIEIDNAEITDGDFGFSLRTSAGSVTNSTASVNCNGIDINGKKSIGSVYYDFEISNNVITTVQGSGITLYSGALATLTNNDIEGASQASGITVYSSTATLHNNEIGPIGGYNGLWLRGSFDVVAENNTIFETGTEPIVAGRYTRSEASASRVFLANNTISTQGAGACSSNTYWGGDFTCPAIHAFVTGVTMYDNVVNAGGSADGIRSVGSLLDIQRNVFNVAKTGAVLRNFDSGYSEADQFGTLGFFSQNTWNGAEMTYNVSKSAVTVQSEYIPSPPSGEFPVRLAWQDQEAWPANGFQGRISPTPVKNCANCANMTPRNFPLALNMDNNSTVFTFANLSNLDLSKVKIATQPTHYAVQVSRAELVRFQTLIKGERVTDTLLIVEDALGNDLYSIKTESDGFTPWISLPSNFHLDFRGLGGGDNPDGFADDEYEDSCSDGIDNDGDLTLDTGDSDCNYSAGTREMSLYRFTAYKFGSGYHRGEFTLVDSSYQETVNLENLAPTVTVTQDNGHSYRRIVNITGSAHDGQLANSYATNQLAQWDQRGYVHSIQVKDPFTNAWEDAGFAVDTSGLDEGMVTKTNRPFSSWYYAFDMSSMAGEGDYTFEFRAFDGIDYSPIIFKTFKLNTLPPTIFITSPSSFSSHDGGSVQFVGMAQDPYGCPSECNKDIGLIYILIEGPNFQVTTPVQSNADGSWEWEWDFSGQPRELATFTFTAWASDSDFCDGIIDECQPVVLTLSIDNSNSQPTISVNQPQTNSRIPVSESSIISGVARDFDGEVTRVDVEVKDVSNDFITVHYASTNEFSTNGEWEIEWDTTQLRHDSDYLIRIRSYDGLDFSGWAEVGITADNPPDADNNQPVFDPAEWLSEITLFCDTESSSANRCTTANIDLLDFFSDSDGDIQYISVFNDTSGATDDNFAIVISVGGDGIAHYNPADMFFYDPDMDSWTLNDVIFIATDSFNSKVNSLPVSFIVVPIQFSIQPPEQSWVEVDGIMLYSGVGLPGKQVSVLIGGLSVNNTIVTGDGTWELGIPASRIQGTSVIPQFSYSGELSFGNRIHLGQPESEGTNWSGIVFGGVFVIVLLGALAYFLIEIEEEEDESEKSPVAFSAELEEPDDPYAWAKSSDSTPSAIVDDSLQLEQHEDHPGWLWDPAKEEWAPDPDYHDPK